MPSGIPEKNLGLRCPDCNALLVVDANEWCCPNERCAVIWVKFGYGRVPKAAVYVKKVARDSAMTAVVTHENTSNLADHISPHGNERRTEAVGFE